MIKEKIPEGIAIRIECGLPAQARRMKYWESLLKRKSLKLIKLATVNLYIIMINQQ